MFDKAQVDLAGEQREGDGADFVEGPALAAAAGHQCFVPDRGNLVAQRGILDVHEIGEEGGDVLGGVGHGAMVSEVGTGESGGKGRLNKVHSLTDPMGSISISCWGTQSDARCSHNHHPDRPPRG